MVFIPPRVNNQKLMPCELLAVVIAFAPLFSKPVFERVKVLVAGAILAVNRRTVSEVLRIVGRGQDKHFQNYHRVLNRAQWSGLAASRILLGLLIAAFVPTGEIVIGLDETIERRWGKKIKARGIYRDADALQSFTFGEVFGFAVALGDGVGGSWICRTGLGVAVSDPVVSIRTV